MPPIPGAAGAAAAPFGCGASTIAHSVVANKEATPEASTKPFLTTLNGSMIPAAIISVNSPLAES